MRQEVLLLKGSLDHLDERWRLRAASIREPSGGIAELRQFCGHTTSEGRTRVDCLERPRDGIDRAKGGRVVARRRTEWDAGLRALA